MLGPGNKEMVTVPPIATPMRTFRRPLSFRARRPPKSAHFENTDVPTTRVQQRITQPQLTILDAQEAEAALEDGRIKDDEDTAANQKRTAGGGCSLCAASLSFRSRSRSRVDAEDGELKVERELTNQMSLRGREAEARQWACARWNDGSIEVDAGVGAGEANLSNEVSEETNDETKSEPVKGPKACSKQLQNNHSLLRPLELHFGGVQAALQPLKPASGYAAQAVDTLGSDREREHALAVYGSVATGRARG
ncbi:hypothetical protein K523DRAFT_356696 [Schizophyllum commune Tattone D]|nr:hypothetical protein K523DRAFT_356696 [Schizophyllum commune Tattone D]